MAIFLSNDLLDSFQAAPEPTDVPPPRPQLGQGFDAQPSGALTSYDPSTPDTAPNVEPWTPYVPAPTSDAPDTSPNATPWQPVASQPDAGAWWNTVPHDLAGARAYAAGLPDPNTLPPPPSSPVGETLRNAAGVVNPFAENSIFGTLAPNANPLVQELARPANYFPIGEGALPLRIARGAAAQIAGRHGSEVAVGSLNDALDHSRTETPSIDPTGKVSPWLTVPVGLGAGLLTGGLGVGTFDSGVTGARALETQAASEAIRAAAPEAFQRGRGNIDAQGNLRPYAIRPEDAIPRQTIVGPNYEQAGVGGGSVFNPSPEERAAFEARTGLKAPQDALAAANAGEYTLRDATRDYESAQEDVVKFTQARAIYENADWGTREGSAAAEQALRDIGVDPEQWDEESIREPLRDARMDVKASLAEVRRLGGGAPTELDTTGRQAPARFPFSGMGGGADVPAEGAGIRAPEPTPPAAADVPSASSRLFGLGEPTQGLSRTDRALNAIKETLGLGVPADDVATPIMRERQRVRGVIDSQAARLGAIADDTVRAFETDKAGRITDLPGQPTVQDVAARLPQYAPYLSDAQQAAMERLRSVTEPFAQALKEQGIDLNSRADVQDGGFYLPRGNADVEGADAPLKVGSGRGGAGGKKGFERGAVFDSMAEGIDAGYQYTPFRDAMQSYGKQAGTRAVDAWAVNSFKATGLGESAADRIDPTLRAKVDSLRSRITSRLQTLRNQSARSGALGQAAADTSRAADRLRGLSLSAETRSILGKAKIEEVDVSSPAQVQQWVPAADALQARADSLRARVGQQASGPLVRQLGETEALLDIRSAADHAGGDVNAMLDEITQNVERSSRYTSEAAANYRPRARGNAAPPFGSPERADWEAARRANGITGRNRASTGPTYEQPPFAGPLAAVNAYEDVLAHAVTDWSVDVSRTPSTEASIRAADRELRILTTESRQAETRAGTAAYRAGSNSAGLAGSQERVSALRDELNQITPEWQRAQLRAAQTPRDQGSIGFSGLNGTTFPDEVANVANKYLADERPASGAGTTVVNAATAFNGLMRGLRASADVSFMGIQGLLGAVQHPIAYGKALTVAFRSLGDPAAFGKFVNDFDAAAERAGRPTSADWNAAGNRLGGTDTEFAVGRGIKKVGPAIQNAPIIKQSNRAFGAFGDTLRLTSSDALYGARQAAGKAVGSAEMADIAKFSNLMTGWSSRRFLGDTGALVEFAPRFFQSQLDLVGNALTNRGIVGSQSRQALVKLIGAGTLLTVAANKARGYDTDFKPDSPNFMRIRNVGGDDVSLFGPWDSLVRAISSGAHGDMTYLARSKASPLVSLAWDEISGKSFTGEDTRTPDYLLRSLLPFGLSQVGQPGHGAADAVIGLTGVKATPLSPTDQVQMGQYFNLKGLPQQKAIPAMTWQTMGEQDFFKAEVKGYSSYFDWYAAKASEVANQLRDSGMTSGDATREAEKAMATHPVTQSYDELRNALEDQWTAQNPELRGKQYDQEMQKPPAERRNLPRKSEQDIIDGYRQAKAAQTATAVGAR